jgi:hypothetical protein
MAHDPPIITNLPQPANRKPNPTGFQKPAGFPQTGYNEADYYENSKINNEITVSCTQT